MWHSYLLLSLTWLTIEQVGRVHLEGGNETSTISLDEWDFNDKLTLEIQQKPVPSPLFSTAVKSQPKSCILLFFHSSIFDLDTNFRQLFTRGPTANTLGWHISQALQLAAKKREIKSLWIEIEREIYFAHQGTWEQRQLRERSSYQK